MTRKALGKGLEALIGEEPQEPIKVDEQPRQGLVKLRVDKIKSNPYQPRTKVDEEKLSELSASIKEKGIIQPVVVRQVGEEFELVAGERRLLAAKRLGWEEIPAVIAGKLSKEDMLELSLIENLQREDLNPIDTAKGYKRLLEECQLTQAEVAQRIGKDRSSVANTMRILGLPEEVRNLIGEGKLSEGHARAILSLSGEREQIALSRRVVNEGLSVRKTENLTQPGRRTLVIRKKARTSPEFFQIEEKLKHYFGTSVKVLGKGKGGKIEIEFYSEEDLTRILEMLQVTL
jgi:ParB family chromosome partitioning protein